MGNYLLALLPGLPISLSLTIVSLIIALALSLVFTTILILRIPILASLVTVYIILFTGTPLLVQIFLIYYGPGQFASIRAIHWIWYLLSQPWLCAVVALALNSCAYSTQLLVGVIRAIPCRQWESCAALGMSQIQSLRILMPLAFRYAIPAYSNEILLVFKSTSLSYTITLMDIMGRSQFIYGLTYDLMIFGAAGIIYLFINGLISFLMNRLEQQVLHFEK